MHTSIASKLPHKQKGHSTQQSPNNMSGASRPKTGSRWAGKKKLNSYRLGGSLCINTCPVFVPACIIQKVALFAVVFGKRVLGKVQGRARHQKTPTNQ